MYLYSTLVPVHRLKKKVFHRCDRQFLTIQCLRCGCSMKILSGSRDRTCPACSRELYYRLIHKYSPMIEGCRHLMLLTLTSKPVVKQSAGCVRELGRWFVKLMHRKPYDSVWKGVLGSVECKKTRSGLFYYHLHCLIDGGYVPQRQISRDWREISGFPIVDIRRVYRTPKRALNYVLKYVMKGSLFSSSVDVKDFKESMKGVRYVRTYGSFYASEYAGGVHVYYPCPVCGAKKCWVVLEFCDLVDLYEGVPYEGGT